MSERGRFVRVSLLLFKFTYYVKILITFPYSIMEHIYKL